MTVVRLYDDHLRAREFGTVHRSLLGFDLGDARGFARPEAVFGEDGAHPLSVLRFEGSKRCFDALWFYYITWS